MTVDRKSLIREYKERRAPMGVYRVYNTITGNALVAASRDLTAILNRHRAQFGMRAHPSAVLQRDWNEHGVNSFVFEILDTLEPGDAPDYNPIDDLTSLEDLWLEKLSLTPDRLHTIYPRRMAPPLPNRPVK